ncbi:MAG: MarR family winged helix-turn-helix transcriptional regulator [Saprospiraceae bacterium]
MKGLKLDEVYFFLLERTVRQFRKFSKEKLGERGIEISSEQWVILKRVSEQEGINQKEMANLTYKDPASVTRMVDLMAKKGWIERQPIVGDRRAYGLHLTKEGKEFVKKMMPAAQDLRAMGLSGISQKELETLKKTLNKIYENML